MKRKRTHILMMLIGGVSIPLNDGPIRFTISIPIPVDGEDVESTRSEIIIGRSLEVKDTDIPKPQGVSTFMLQKKRGPLSQSMRNRFRFSKVRSPVAMARAGGGAKNPIGAGIGGLNHSLMRRMSSSQRGKEQQILSRQKKRLTLQKKFTQRFQNIYSKPLRRSSTGPLWKLQQRLAKMFSS